jgi:protease I
MLQGLEGRSIAVLADDGEGNSAREIVRDLEQAGATIHRQQIPSEQDLHSGRYAALVLATGAETSERAAADDRFVQLVREFLASDKPIAALGPAVGIVARAGGVAGRTVSAPPDASLRTSLASAGATLVEEAVCVDQAMVTAGDSARAREFAERLIREFSDCLEERQLDEMSDLSFPASDPPASTPSYISRDRDADARA